MPNPEDAAKQSNVPHRQIQAVGRLMVFDIYPGVNIGYRPSELSLSPADYESVNPLLGVDTITMVRTIHEKTPMAPEHRKIA